MHSRIARACTLGVLLGLFSAGLTSTAHAAKPSAPTGLRATTTESTAVLTWGAASGATKYRVCLKTARDTPCHRFSPTSSKLSWHLSGLKPTSDTDYYFLVTAYAGSETRSSKLKGFNLRPVIVPAAPTGITQVVSSSEATISWPAAKNATAYSICLSSSAAVTRCNHESPQSPDRTVTFSDLTPTAGGDYFYRIRSHRGSKSALSARQRIDLPVATVPDLTPVRGPATGELTATWPDALNSERYETQIATNAAMTTSLRTLTTPGPAMSQAGLTIGTTYYVRTRGMNPPAVGAWSRVRTIRLPSLPARVTVLTYNLCGQDKCVTRANRMKKWSTRRTYAGDIARASGADVIATQESHDEDTRFGRELPGFRLAAYYSAKSLFYDAAKYDALRSGRITLSAKEKKYAVWAELRDKASRTSFIVADVHLQPYKGKRLDDLRAAQTKVLLSRIAAANPQDLPVVYAGDYNSNQSNADQKRYQGGYDAPAKVFGAAGIVDAVSLAPNPIHRDFNSANQAVNPPLRHGHHVDHIYVDPRIRVFQWRVVVAMATGGRLYATPFATDHNAVRAVLQVVGR